MQVEHPTYAVAVAFPDVDRKLIASTCDALARLAIGVFLVRENREVIDASPAVVAPDSKPLT